MLLWAGACLAALLLTALPALAQLDDAGAPEQTPPASAAPAPAADAPSFPLLRDDGRKSAQPDPLLLVVEGIDAVIRPAALRARLSSLFGRPVLALSDPDSERAVGTLWLALDAQQLTLRLSTPPRPDLSRRLLRTKLGADPALTIANVVLDLLWSERISPPKEMRDPFCAPGMVCDDGAGSAPAGEPRRSAEQSVLDPWDAAYPRFDRSPRYPTRGDPWATEEPGYGTTGASDASAAGTTPTPASVPRREPARAEAERTWVLAALLGGGVYQAGGFARYEVSGLRRFPRADLGLSFVAARGQPSGAYARRAVVGLAQYRWITEGLELDLGGSFGIFVASRYGSTDIRPYLRAHGTFALSTRAPLDVLLQTELATTFTRVGSTGAVEYALSLGVRLPIPLRD